MNIYFSTFLSVSQTLTQYIVVSVSWLCVYMRVYIVMLVCGIVKRQRRKKKQEWNQRLREIQRKSMHYNIFMCFFLRFSCVVWTCVFSFFHWQFRQGNEWARSSETCYSAVRLRVNHKPKRKWYIVANGWHCAEEANTHTNIRAEAAAPPTAPSVDMKMKKRTWRRNNEKWNVCVCSVTGARLCVRFGVFVCIYAVVILLFFIFSTLLLLWKIILCVYVIVCVFNACMMYVCLSVIY